MNSASITECGLMTSSDGDADSFDDADDENVGTGTAPPPPIATTSANNCHADQFHGNCVRAYQRMRVEKNEQTKQGSQNNA